jgi:hypothetical protein
VCSDTGQRVGRAGGEWRTRQEKRGGNKRSGNRTLFEAAPFRCPVNPGVLTEAGRMARAVHTELQTQIHIINAISANPPATHPATFNNIFPNTPSSAGMKFCFSVLRHSPELAKSVFAGMPMSGYYELEESRALRRLSAGRRRRGRRFGVAARVGARGGVRPA